MSGIYKTSRVVYRWNWVIEVHFSSTLAGLLCSTVIWAAVVKIPQITVVIQPQKGGLPLAERSWLALGGKGGGGLFTSKGTMERETGGRLGAVPVSCGDERCSTHVPPGRGPTTRWRLWPGSTLESSRNSGGKCLWWGKPGHLCLGCCLFDPAQTKRMTTRQESTVANGSPGHPSVSETRSHLSLMLLEVCVMPCCSIKFFFFFICPWVVFKTLGVPGRERAVSVSFGCRLHWTGVRRREHLNGSCQPEVNLDLAERYRWKYQSLEGHEFGETWFQAAHLLNGWLLQYLSNFTVFAIIRWKTKTYNQYQASAIK